MIKTVVKTEINSNKRREVKRFMGRDNICYKNAFYSCCDEHYTQNLHTPNSNLLLLRSRGERYLTKRMMFFPKDPFPAFIELNKRAIYNLSWWLKTGSQHFRSGLHESPSPPLDLRVIGYIRGQSILKQTYLLPGV
jgi:hypothetical protein